jgi:hypothetical protein
METVYKPHRYLFTLGKSIPPVTIGCSVLCWLPTLFIEVFLFHHLYMPLLRLSLVANLTVFFLALFFSMILHEVCGTTYSISETTIVKKSPYKTALIHFENVTRFLYVRLPLVKGYGLIKVPSGSLRLPFTIGRLDACIEEIRQRLEACGKQGAYDHRNLEEYKFKAVINEMSVERMQRTIPMLFQIIIGGMAESAFIAQFFWEMSLKWVLSWTFSGVVFPVMGYLIAEMILNHRTIRRARHHSASLVPDPKSTSDSIIDESKIYWLVGLVTAMVYTVAGLIFKNAI